MPKFNFVGPSYVYRNTSFDAQRSVNYYPANSESGSSKDQFILCPTPGKSLFLTLPTNPIRGMYYAASVGRAFVVAFNRLYELLPNGTYIDLSTASGGFLLGTSQGAVSISDNGLQLIIVDGPYYGGSPATGMYIFTFSISTSFIPLNLGSSIGGGTTVAFLDGYFIKNKPNTQQYNISALYDGSSWDSTMFANAEGSPDNLSALITAHRQTFLVGTNTIQVAYNSGSSPFPLDQVQGVFIQYGTNLPFSVCQTANTIFWIGNDQDGTNTVWMAEGYQPKRISTQAIEYYLGQYSLSGTVCYTYQEDGHYFYVINIPGAKSTLVHDITTQLWHERAYWNSSIGLFERDRANLHMYAFNKHLVSDYINGNIYEQSLKYNNDNGVDIRRMRTMPYFVDNLEFLYFKKIQIDMNVGNGLITDTDPQNVTPQAILRWSDDSGNTWSNEHYMDIGAIGNYMTRVQLYRLGRSRFRIFEFTMIANVPTYLINAQLDVEAGLA